MKKKQVLAFISRELKLLFSDKVALFWVIVWPIFWVFMTAYVFIPPGTGSPVKLTVGIVNYDVDAAFFNITEVLTNVTYGEERLFTARVYSDRESLVSDLKGGKLDAGLVIPRGFFANLTYGIARLEVLIGARDPRTASITYGLMKGFVDEFSRRTGLMRANVTLQYVYKYAPPDSPLVIDPAIREYIELFILGIAIPINATFTDVKPEALANREAVLGWFLIGAVGMMFLYTGFSSGATLLTREKETGTLKRIMSSPVTPPVLIAGLILSDIVVLILSAVILIVVGVFCVGARIVFNPLNPFHWLVPLLILAGALMCEGVGVILSLLAKTSRGASGLGVVLGLVLSFTAGIWLPREMMPGAVKYLAEYFPPTWVFDAVRKILVFNTPLEDLAQDLVKIVLALTAILVVDLIVYKTRLQKFITSF